MRDKWSQSQVDKVSSFELQIGKMKTDLTTNEFTIICLNSYGIKITNLSYQNEEMLL